MALVVEDGSIVSGADTYVSLADAETYISNRHAKQPWTNASDADKEKALRLATEYLDNHNNFIGYVVNSDQFLLWPRSVGIDNHGRMIDIDEIPQVLKNAQCHLAHEYLDNGDLAASYDRETQSESVGSLSVTYFRGKNTRSYPEVEGMLKSITHSGNKLKRT